MEYFAFFVLLPIMIAVIALSVKQIKYWRQNLIENILAENLLDKKFFTTLVLENWAKYIDRLPLRQKKEQTALIVKGKMQKIVSTIEDLNLRAQVNCLLKNKATNDMRNGDELSRILYVTYLWAENKKITLRPVSAKTNKKTRGLQLLVSARLNLREGQLKEASLDIERALSIFKKQKWLYEEATAYIVWGEIYRMAGEYDIAEMMYKSALKIWQKINCLTGVCEVLGNLGTLCAAQARWQEAEDYFTRAEAINIRHKAEKLHLSILCHHAILEVMRQKPKQALRRIEHIKVEKYDDDMKALILSVQVRAEAALHHQGKACKLGKEVFDLYWKRKKYAQAWDIKYLTADIYLQEKKYLQAELILRDLLKAARKKKTNVALEDVYTALGLAMLGRGDFAGAKKYFYEALNLEIGNNNFAGAAVDYMNLAEVFRQSGDIEKECRCLDGVLQYADGNEEIFIQAQKRREDLGKITEGCN